MIKSEKIDGYELYNYISSGAEKLISNEKYLNSINVFPIADGDTGSNLSFTMKCILAKAKPHNSASQTLKSISEIAVEDSFGNSGTIFASYLFGLSEESKKRDSLSTSEFVEVALNAVDYAYNSISKPMEGTILTVIKEWALFLDSNKNTFENRKVLFKEAIIHAKKTLNNTKFQLKELYNSDVVDAGGMGFVCFLEGIMDFFEYGKVFYASNEPEYKKRLLNHTMEFNYRYCVEMLVETNSNIKNKSFENELSSISDSIAVQDSNNIIKVHCHTNEPHKITTLLKNKGNIIKSKVDDMYIQSLIVNKRKYKIGLITDTIADIPDKLIDEEQIIRIPLHMIIDNNVFVDRYTITNESLFEILKKTHSYPSSAQPGNTYIEKTLTHMLSNFDYVIGVFVSNKMSGLYDKVLSISNKLNSDKLFIIDSLHNSASQGLIVNHVLSQIKENKNVLDIVVDTKKDIKNFKTYVEIPNLSYAAKSGRVPKIISSITNKLKLKVIISIDENGKGIVVKETSLKRLINKKSKQKNIKSYSIVHSGNLKGAYEYAEYMKMLTNKEPLFIQEVSTIVSAFVGKGAVGIGYEEE